MGIYYCPNCNADLEDQSGFDPSNGTWTCTVCGRCLMDDDVYEGDTYDGVAWFCDNCGSLLNRQSGFSDGCGSWTCTECGYNNGTTEDDIFDSEESYRNHINYSSKQQEDDDSNDKEPEICCPNCGTNLRDQWEYDDYCNDYTCTECYAKLHRDYSFDDLSIVENDDNSYDECSVEENDDNSDRGNINSSYTSVNNSSPSSYNILPQSKILLKRAKAFFFKNKSIPVGYSSYSLKGKNVEEVYAILHNCGFKHIKRTELKDVYINSLYRENDVDKVEFNGRSQFEANSEFPYDANVVITVHRKREITISFSSSSLRKRNYKEICSMLSSLGFTEIQTLPIKDLVTGWVTKNGSVENVVIDGRMYFKKNMVFKYDVNITVYYHTFKKRGK